MKLLYCFEVLLAVTSASQPGEPSVQIKGYNEGSTLPEINQKELFVDVIRNITRVNAMLEDLISNYEKIKNIYRSEESLDYSSDSEIDPVYRQRLLNESLKSSTRTTTKNDFIATEMYISNEKAEESSNDSNSTEMISRETVNQSDPSTENRVTTTTKKQKNSKKTNYASLINLDPHRTKNIAVTTKTTKVKESELDNVSSLESLEDMKNFLKLNIDKRNSDSNQAITRPKLRSKKQLSKKNTNREYINYLHYNTTDSPSVKKVIKSEKFGDSYWNDVKYNKPTNLKTEKEIVYSDEKRNASTSHHRTQIGNEVDTSSLESPELISEDTNIKSDQMKTKILKRAYGDACLKVVIRKCYKACMFAQKTVCSIQNCKIEFKLAFKTNSKRSCIAEFVPTTPLELRTEKHSKYFDEFGFLEAANIYDACLPDTTEVTYRQSYTKTTNQLNILRDKYERECRRVSIEKCTKACKNALKEACVTQHCTSYIRRSFESKCQRACTSSYADTKEKKIEDSGSYDSGSSGSSSVSKSSRSSSSSIELLKEKEDDAVNENKDGIGEEEDNDKENEKQKKPKTKKKKKSRKMKTADLTLRN